MMQRMTCAHRSTLAHDITNKIFAILAHCEELELRIPSPWVFERTAKIKALVDEVSELVRSREEAPLG